MGRLHALLILAWALVRSLLAPLVGARRGLADFRRSYAADRLMPIAPDERRSLSQMSGCIACGLCDAGEGARMARSAGTYAGVMDLMLASSRSMPDYDAAARSFDAVGDDRLAELERRCPTRVPMRTLAAFVRTKAAEMGAPARGDRTAPRDIAR
jgi:succinate dehydrogenase/fumarate reductase-like Fe-S protein